MSEETTPEEEKITLFGKLSKAESTAILALSYTVGFFLITAYFALQSMAYTLTGMLGLAPAFPDKIFLGLLTGEGSVLGFYFGSKNHT